MRVISQDAVNEVDPSDDLALSQLGNGVEPFAVINPELDMSVLEYVNLNHIPSSTCFKYKMGQGWIVKVFPANWNGTTRISQVVPKKYDLQINYYVETNDTSYVPDAWDLKYTHLWNYEGTTIPAMLEKYLPITQGTKVVGTVKFIDCANAFDVVFISNNEINAEDNWERLLSKWPQAKRVNGVKGILNAHKEAATLATTEMVWIIDADAYLVDDFIFKSVPYNRNAVNIWYSRNPLNGLEYGYGGVKLFPRDQLINNQDTTIIDVSTSVCAETQVMKEVACETRFNTDPFNTWKSAFRECAKLSSGTIKNQISKETTDRLNAWCTIGNEWSISGALAGKAYGEQHKDNLININNYEWLHKQFNSR